MADQKISSRSLVSSISGTEKIPVGTSSNEAITPNQLKSFIQTTGGIHVQEEFLISPLVYFETGALTNLSDVVGVNTQEPDSIGVAFIGYDSVGEDVYLASKFTFPIGIGRAIKLRARIKSNEVDWNLLQMGFSDATENAAGQSLLFRIMSGNFNTYSQGSNSDQVADTLTPVVADRYYHIRIEINADATEVKYYVDDNLVETVADAQFIPKFNADDSNYMRVFFYCVSPNSNPVALHTLRIDYIDLEFS